MEHQSAGTAGSGPPNRLTRRNRDIGSPVHLSDSSPSRLLKNTSTSTGECGTKKHARNGRAAKSGIQLLIAGGTGAEGSSAARIRGMVDEVRARLSPQFDAMYANVGRPSIAPEKLLRAQLLQMLYTIRSERLLMEEMDYNLLFRWFVGLNADDAVWDATVFTKNRDRLLEADVAKLFLAQVVEQARGRGLTSDEHFTVDGTLLEAWAGAKSFQPKAEKKTPPPDDDPDHDAGNPTVNFHGEKRSNDTHESKTDPESLLARKGQGKEAKLSYSGHLLVENKNGLIVDAGGLQANGTAERDAALLMLEKLGGTKTVKGGRHQGFYTTGFVSACRHQRSTPHVAQNRARA